MFEGRFFVTVALFALSKFDPGKVLANAHGA